jgi:hypothetical protein
VAVRVDLERDGTGRDAAEHGVGDPDEHRVSFRWGPAASLAGDEAALTITPFPVILNVEAYAHHGARHRDGRA